MVVHWNCGKLNGSGVGPSWMNDYQRSRMKIGPYFGLKTTLFEVEKGGLRDYGIVRNSAMITIRNKTADVEKIKPRNTPNTQKDLVIIHKLLISIHI